MITGNGPRGPNVGVSTDRYDSEGWLIESDQYDPCMTPHFRTAVTRQPDGSTISESRTVARAGALVSYSTATFDARRKQTGANAFNADGSVQWTDVIFRTSLGETIQERVGEDGSLLSRTIWFDGQDGSRIMESTSYRAGAPLSRSRHVYNQQGRFVSGETYDQNGRLSHRSVLDYREDGQRGAETTYGANGMLTSQQTYLYDGDGRKTGATQFSYHEDGRPPSKTLYTYGPNDLMTSMTHVTSGLLAGVQVSYEFDEQGNWIRQTTSHCRSGTDEFGTPWQDPSPCEVLIRTITYHDPVEPVASSGAVTTNSQPRRVRPSPGAGRRRIPSRVARRA